LSLLLAQPHPPPAVLREHILDRHPERRADPGEGIDHEADQRPITQTDNGRRVDPIEQRARFRGIEHRNLSGRYHVPGPVRRRGRVDRHHLAGDEPVEQVTDRGETLLDARRRELARRGLDPCGDVHRLHGADQRHAGARAPGQKFIGSAGIGAARVRVADVGREEFEEAHAGTLAGGGECRQGSRSDRDELVHVS
jgi:hypothetical protein